MSGGRCRALLRSGVSLGLLLGVFAAHAQRLACTLIVDAHSGRTVVEQGGCDTRVTPASTFKIPLSLIGFDAGVLQNAHAPTFQFRPGDPDWGGPAWLLPADPARWMQWSVVWFSQRVTHTVGATALQRYVQAFGYGNADLSGDAGRNNGLDRAWISSSLQVSAREQVAFLRRLVQGELPVSAQAVRMTAQITAIGRWPGGWQVHGKTGTAFPRRADGVSDTARGYGWFVGWAVRGGRVLAFARLAQDTQVHDTPHGLRVRDALKQDWASLVTTLAP